MQLPLELFGVCGIRLCQHRGGEGVLVGPAERDPRIRQVGVDFQVSVAGRLGAAARGGDACANQRDDEVARQRRRLRLGRRDHLGHRHGTSAVVHPHPHRRRKPEPAVGRIIQCVWVFRGVDGLVGAGFVQQREASPDHRVADLAHRHATRHGARPAQPQQLVLAGELVDRGAAVDARNIVPQGQRLGVAQHRTDPPAHHEPLAERGMEALHGFRCGAG